MLLVYLLIRLTKSYGTIWRDFGKRFRNGEPAIPGLCVQAHRKDRMVVRIEGGVTHGDVAHGLLPTDDCLRTPTDDCPHTPYPNRIQQHPLLKRKPPLRLNLRATRPLPKVGFVLRLKPWASLRDCHSNKGHQMPSHQHDLPFHPTLKKDFSKLFSAAFFFLFHLFNAHLESSA